MADLEKIADRIETVEGIGQLLNGLKTLSSVTAHEFASYLDAVNSYHLTNTLALKCLESHLASADDHSVTRTAWIVIGPERGFCGQYRERIADELYRHLQTKEQAAPILAIGTRQAQTLSERQFTLTRAYALPATRQALKQLISNCLSDLDQQALLSPTTQINCLYARHEASVGIAAQTVALWPLTPEDIAAVISKPWPSSRLPAPLGNVKDIIRIALRQRFYTRLLRAMVQSIVTEHTARLKTLDQTEQNIKDMLEDMTLDAHQARQRAITEELIELNASFQNITEAG